MSLFLNYKKFPDAEQRTPRSTFTKRLSSICSRLDKCPVKVTSLQELFYGKTPDMNISAQALWVVGSYARGALTCGDLDLVMQCSADSVEPDICAVPAPWTVSKALAGGQVGVRIHEGTPLSNTSGVKFSEAVLIWQPGMDWQAAIESIRLNPDFTRYERPSDAFPFRSEQMRGTWDSANNLLKQFKAGVIQWTFRPLSALTPVFEPDTSEEIKALRVLGNASQMKKKLAPLTLGFIREFRKTMAVQPALSVSIFSPWVEVGPHRVVVDRVDLAMVDLDDISCASISFIPSLNMRGPNGVWTVERGPNHPLVKQVQHARAWCTLDENNSPVVWKAHTQTLDETVSLVDMFSTQEGAQGDADVLNADCAPCAGQPGHLVPRLLAGRKLLEVFGMAEALVLDGTAFALTHNAVAYCKDFNDEITSSYGAPQLSLLLKTLGGGEVQPDSPALAL